MQTGAAHTLMTLEFRNVNVHYGAIHALKGISFTVEPGKIVTLIGANGAGKSTTLRAVSGLLRASSGEILFEGQAIGGRRTDHIVAMGISQAPEGRGIFANMTVEENLELGAFLRKDKDGIKKDMEHVFELFPRVKERLWQNAGTLSGGEQQMLAIGRALMARPKLLLLDEPSLGLAPQIIEKIFETIVKVNQAGMTVLLVEQNALLALEVAHYALVLETGKIMMQGKASDLLGSEEIRKAYLGE
ncbi:MAG: ABC transporter ATP-binding protein [Deltaproteobacteria bacterium]|nr:ABC transporter ATP-binding protein [Deltaproteobacteria bacterium]